MCSAACTPSPSLEPARVDTTSTLRQPSAEPHPAWPEPNCEPDPYNALQRPPLSLYDHRDLYLDSAALGTHTCVGCFSKAGKSIPKVFHVLHRVGNRYVEHYPCDGDNHIYPIQNKVWIDHGRLESSGFLIDSIQMDGPDFVVDIGKTNDWARHYRLHALQSPPHTYWLTHADDYHRGELVVADAHRMEYGYLQQDCYDVKVAEEDPYETIDIEQLVFLKPKH